jgi:membrane protein YdbS with pleckstrin-like domain
MYSGIWGVLTGWFRVPKDPPALPVRSGARHESFQPSAGYLRYLKFEFWVLLVLIDIVLTGLWVAATVALLYADQAVWAGIIALPALALIVLPDVVAYIAIHLRYDTMWYVLTDRSVRIRRGVWVIHEMTITFENVQNVTVEQGPLERWFGIASVVIDTAGGGGAQHPSQAGLGHRGVLQGIGNAHHVRDLILERVRASTSAGLGDERTRSASGSVNPSTPGATTLTTAAPRWSPAHIAELRAIRDAIRRPEGRPGSGGHS